ncbi:nuclear transport factor 2 family protein [Enterococcus sp. LJL128]|uniref:nuclear transport factor 2 family protein n=1 Tax=Enterococcus sp. LJL51 TaxID=3416656 RepID=UPI003CE94DEB
MKRDIVLDFVAAINHQDLPQIIQMMSEDFCFIDTYGDKEDKEQMKIGWQGYFDWFPDYTIEVDDYIESEKFSMIIGTASASYLGNKSKSWYFPACWKVVVKNNQIQLWQVFCDSKKQLDSMK